MTAPKIEALADQLEDLLQDDSLPELLAALILLCREYRDEMKEEGHGEWQGWAVWADALEAAFSQAMGKEELESLLED